MICGECITEIQGFIDKKPPEERGYWEPITDIYFCLSCKKIYLNKDGTYQDNNRYCQCLNKFIDGEAVPENYDEIYNGWDDGC